MKVTRHDMRLVGAALTALASGCSLAEGPPNREPDSTTEQASSSNPLFGVWCQADYQGGWLPTLSHSWDRCSGLIDQMNATVPELFYWNLHGAKPFFEGALDQVWTEAADFVFLNTHGGAFSTTAAYAMWNSNVNAFTTSMALGNESRGTSIFSSYACQTLADDGKIPTRWASTLGGGLRMVTGSFDTVYDSWTTDDVGEDYAEDLQDGDTIAEAWKDGASDWYADADLGVLATGTNKTNCFDRINGMTFQNFSSFPALKTGAIGFFCRRFWST